MKLTSVELHPHGAEEVLELSFKDPRRLNPFNVKTIWGLDADEIIPRFYKATGDSTKHYILSLEKREVVVRIELNPRFRQGETYSSLRDKVYRLIASTRTGQIHVHLQGETGMIAAITGFVTKIEAPQFEKNQEVQITIKCDDAMLRGMDRINVDVTGLDPALTVITDDLSTAPHGHKWEITFLADTPSFRISTTGYPECEFEVTPVGGFLIGDVLHFSSEYQDKYIYVVRGVDTIHLADVITPGSVWPLLFPGTNECIIDNPTTVEWTAISYRTAYWGV